MQLGKLPWRLVKGLRTLTIFKESGGDGDNLATHFVCMARLLAADCLSVCLDHAQLQLGTQLTQRAVVDKNNI